MTNKQRQREYNTANVLVRQRHPSNTSTAMYTRAIKQPLIVSERTVCHVTVAVSDINQTSAVSQWTSKQTFSLPTNEATVYGRLIFE